MCKRIKSSTMHMAKGNHIVKMYFLAHGFHFNFTDNYERILNGVKNDSGYVFDHQDKDIMAVCAVNAYFAAELYFKMLYAFEKYDVKKDHSEFPNGHNLHKLFASLKGKMQNEIVNELIKSSPSLDATIVRKILKDQANGFEKWRYIFSTKESESFNAEFFRPLLDVLGKVRKEDILNGNILKHDDTDNISHGMTIPIATLD